MNVNVTLSHTTEVISGVAQGFFIGHTPFVIYVNDLPDHLPTNRLLYANDVKLIAPHNHCEIIQSSLNVRASWSKDWELYLYPTKSEHISIGKSPSFITYTLPSHNPPNPKFELSQTPGSMLKIMSSTLLIKPAGCYFVRKDLSRLLPPVLSPLVLNFNPASS